MTRSCASSHKAGPSGFCTRQQRSAPAGLPTNSRGAPGGDWPSSPDCHTLNVPSSPLPRHSQEASRAATTRSKTHAAVSFPVRWPAKPTLDCDFSVRCPPRWAPRPQPSRPARSRAHMCFSRQLSARETASSLQSGRAPCRSLSSYTSSAVSGSKRVPKRRLQLRQRGAFFGVLTHEVWSGGAP